MQLKKALSHALAATTIATSLFGLGVGAQAAFNAASNEGAAPSSTSRMQLVTTHAPLPTFWKWKCWYDQNGQKQCRRFWIP